MKRAVGVITYSGDAIHLLNVVNDPSGLGHFSPPPSILAGNVEFQSRIATSLSILPGLHAGTDLSPFVDRSLELASRSISFFFTGSKHTVSMDDCTLHRNHFHHRQGGTPTSPQSKKSWVSEDAAAEDDDELDLEKALCRPRPPVSPSVDLDAVTVHKKRGCDRYDDPEEADGSAEDPTCEMSLSTMETEYGLEGLQQMQQHQPQRFGGRYHSCNNRDEHDGSSSFTELAFASMDMDRHGGFRRGGGGLHDTEHNRPNRYTSSFSNNDLNDASYCDGMGESMFGESFALDDSGPSFDVESHHQQRASLQASRSSQLVVCPVVDEE